MKCDSDIMKELYGNIVLSGGSSMFPGIGSRLKEGVASLAPTGTNIKVLEHPERKFRLVVFNET